MFAKASWWFGAAVVAVGAAFALVILGWNLFLASGRMNGMKIEGETA